MYLSQTNYRFWQCSLYRFDFKVILIIKCSKSQDDSFKDNGLTFEYRLIKSIHLICYTS